MKPEKIAREIMAYYEKPVYDYHYDGTVIYPEDAMKMLMEFYEAIRTGKKVGHKEHKEDTKATEI